MTKFLINNICEHDMDLAISWIFMLDKNFSKLFIDDVNTILSVEISKVDSELGESDITVIVQIGNEKIGLLIEDKMDAIAMPNQPERYDLRGQKGIKVGDYDEYMTFIVCPKKYYENNDAAKEYGKAVFYEDILDYLRSESDISDNVLLQLFEQAINKSKKPPKVKIDEQANLFFRAYKKYQQNNYPLLDLRTKETSNGYWAEFGTRLGNAFIYHKMEAGRVDLTLSNAATHMIEIELVVKWLREHGLENVKGEVTGKSGAISIRVPILNYRVPFDETDETIIQECFDAIEKLSDMVNICAELKRLACL